MICGKLTTVEMWVVRWTQLAVYFSWNPIIAWQDTEPHRCINPGILNNMISATPLSWNQKKKKKNMTDAAHVVIPKAELWEINESWTLRANSMGLWRDSSMLHPEWLMGFPRILSSYQKTAKSKRQLSAGVYAIDITPWANPHDVTTAFTSTNQHGSLTPTSFLFKTDIPENLA